MVKQATAKKVQAQPKAQAKAQAKAQPKAQATQAPAPVLTLVRDGSKALALAAARAAKFNGNAPATYGDYTCTQKITVLQAYPCKKQSGNRFKAWQAIAAAKTVGDYALTGMGAKYLKRWATATDSAPAYIRIS